MGRGESGSNGARYARLSFRSTTYDRTQAGEKVSSQLLQLVGLISEKHIEIKS